MYQAGGNEKYMQKFDPEILGEEPTWEI